MHALRPILLNAVVATGAATSAHGSFTTVTATALDEQNCTGLEWTSTFGPTASASGTLLTGLAVFDNGSGPAIYLSTATSAGFDGFESNVVRWDGTTWTDVGFIERISAMLPHDDGTGRRLHAGGRDAVARLNDADQWTTIGDVDGRINTIAEYDESADGTPELFVGGTFASIDGAPLASIARWDGAQWTALEGEINVGGFQGVLAMAVHDDGSGPALFVGGEISDAGEPAVSNIARWDGTDWSPLGTGVNGLVRAIASFDDGLGGGPMLYAAGDFDTAGGAPANQIARWDGTSWSPVDSGLTGGLVRSLTVHDDGTGMKLYAGGSFDAAGDVSASGVARWDGMAWSPVPGIDGALRRLVSTDAMGDGSPLLFGVGFVDYDSGIGAAETLTRWDGESWAPPGSGLAAGTVRAMEMTSLGAPGTGGLFVGGDMTSAGTVRTSGLARFAAGRWWDVGGGVRLLAGHPTVHALESFDDGAGAEALYVAGNFSLAGSIPANRIARWDGHEWSALGSGIPPGNVSAMVGHDDGGPDGRAFFVGGTFSSTGGAFAGGAAIWNGRTWTRAGTRSSFIDAFAATDGDESTPGVLYASGGFFNADDEFVKGVARWHDDDWEVIGELPTASGSNSIFDLAFYDDGTGPALIAGGRFTTIGGIDAINIASWNGTTWSPIGSGLQGPGTSWARRLVVHRPTAEGPSILVAAGRFNEAGGAPASGLAQWDGTAWTAIGPGLPNASVRAMHAVDNGSLGRSLLLGGSFVTAPSGDGFIARLACPSVAGDVDGSGTVDISDLLHVLSAWSTCESCTHCPADLDGDCEVSLPDLMLVLAEWDDVE